MLQGVNSGNDQMSLLARFCGSLLTISILLQLLDLCFLDMGCLKFTYSVLATSALYHMSSQQVALSVSGESNLVTNSSAWIMYAACRTCCNSFDHSLWEIQCQSFMHACGLVTHRLPVDGHSSLCGVDDTFCYDSARSWLCRTEVLQRNPTRKHAQYTDTCCGSASSPLVTYSTFFC